MKYNHGHKSYSLKTNFIFTDHGSNGRRTGKSTLATLTIHLPHGMRSCPSTRAKQIRYKGDCDDRRANITRFRYGVCLEEGEGELDK